ncbi:MAG TPA: hypothetical protein VME40_14600 [Caulobacteraceae bacterium]|nr:hypothetical protein [Caulobacteraceae bacterium]
MKPCEAPHDGGGELAASSWESKVINPIISAGSNALQALEQLWSARQSSPGAGAAGAFSTGQSLPTGANSTSGGQAPSSPGDQFNTAALSFLTSLQDAGSSAAQQLTSSGYLPSQAQGAVQQGLGDLTSIVNQLEQALSDGAGGATASSATPTSLASTAASALTGLASTASAAASALTSGTPTATASALSQLMTELQSLGLGGGRHHHHRWGGWQSSSGASSSETGSTSGSNSSTGTATVAAVTPTAAGAAG